MRARFALQARLCSAVVLLLVAAAHAQAGNTLAEKPALGKTAAIAKADDDKTPANLKFHGWDVISVKPNKSGSGSSRISSDETVLFTQNVSIKMMLTNAYGIRDGLITGLPPWANSTRWDINAKLVDPDPAMKDRHLSRQESENEYHAKMLNILSERFHLRAHTETKVGPIFDLVVTKPGPNLKKTDPSESDHGSHWNNTNLKATGMPLSAFALSLIHI